MNKYSYVLIVYTPADRTEIEYFNTFRELKNYCDLHREHVYTACKIIGGTTLDNRDLVLYNDLEEDE